MKFKEFPLLNIWEVWKTRNICIFYNENPSISLESSRSISLYFECRKEKKPPRHRMHLAPQLDESLSMGYFDGVEKNGICGVGMVLKIKRDHIIILEMG